MRRRALGPAVHGWLDTIRDGHPDTPVRLVSPIFCGVHEATPGPTAPDMAAMAEGRRRLRRRRRPRGRRGRGALTLEVVREVLAEVVERRGDPHLSYVDGLGLYGAADAERLPLPDGLHPDTATHRLIGERFAALGGLVGLDARPSIGAMARYGAQFGPDITFLGVPACDLDDEAYVRRRGRRDRRRPVRRRHVAPARAPGSGRRRSG